VPLDSLGTQRNIFVAEKGVVEQRADGRRCGLRAQMVSVLGGRTQGTGAVIRELGLLWRRFSPLEERLLSEVRRVLPTAAVSAFDAQVAAINHVQRLPPSWSEIDFYCMTGGKKGWLIGAGKASWVGVPMFPCTDEFRLAEVSFRIAGKSYKATLSSIQGHIFDFATAPGPRAVAFDPWDETPIARLLGDPLRAPTGHKEPEAIPVEWQEFLTRHPGPPPDGWAFHDERTARRVALGDGVYLILAERDGAAFILHRVEPAANVMFYLPHYDGDPEPLEGDLEMVVGVTQQ
jgi:hypothetical protein